MKSYNHFSHDSENLLNEDLNRFVTKFRQHYRSGKKYSFREWMSIFSDLIEELEWHQIRILKKKILLTSRCDKTREIYQIHFSQKNPVAKIAFAGVASLITRNWGQHYARSDLAWHQMPLHHPSSWVWRKNWRMPATSSSASAISPECPYRGEVASI